VEQARRGLVQARVRAQPLPARHLPRAGILKAGVIPAEQVLTNEAYQGGDASASTAQPVYSHIARPSTCAARGRQVLVLEDNLRTPSGVS